MNFVFQISPLVFCGNDTWLCDTWQEFLSFLDLALYKLSYRLVSFLGSVAWEQNWLTGKCSRAHAFTLAFKLWACGRCCWKKVFLTTVRLCVICLHTCSCKTEILNLTLTICAVLLWHSGPGTELPGQVPFLPLPGWWTGGRSFSQRGREEGEPWGAAGHPAPPLTDWAWRPHEDDSEETVGL